MTISAMPRAISGAWISAMARLVSGDERADGDLAGRRGAQRVDDEIDAVLRRGCIVGSGRAGPSRPVGPCTCAAVTSVRRIGLGQPAIDRNIGPPRELQKL